MILEITVNIIDPPIVVHTTCVAIVIVAANGNCGVAIITFVAVAIVCICPREPPFEGGLGGRTLNPKRE